MKKKVIVIAIIILIVIIIGIMYINKIGIFNPYFNKTVDIDKVIKEIEVSTSISSMVEKDIMEINEFNDINLEKIENFKIYSSFMGITADEIVIFKVTDKKYLNELKEIFEKRVFSLKEEFNGFVSSQNAVIDEYEIKIYNDTRPISNST